MFKEGSRPQKSYNSQEWDFSWELCLVLTLAETPRLERVIPPRGKIFIKLSHFSSDVSVANRFWRCAPLRFTERARAHPNTKSRCRWQKGGRTISLGKKFLRGYWGWPFVSDVWIAIIIIMCIYIYIHPYILYYLVELPKPQIHHTIFGGKIWQGLSNLSEGTTGPSLQVTEVAAAKADEDLQAWLPWFSAESRIYMNLRKNLNENKRILKYLWYSKKAFWCAGKKLFGRYRVACIITSYSSILGHTHHDISLVTRSPGHLTYSLPNPERMWIVLQVLNQHESTLACLATMNPSIAYLSCW